MTPSSMNTYIIGIQRAFKLWGYELDLRNGRVFSCPKEGLKGLMDNVLSVQQAQGKITKGHNSLAADDVETLYRPENLSR